MGGASCAPGQPFRVTEIGKGASDENLASPHIAVGVDWLESEGTFLRRRAFVFRFEYVTVTSAYSNAVMLALLSRISEFAERANLPVVTPIQTKWMELAVIFEDGWRLYWRRGVLIGAARAALSP